MTFFGFPASAIIGFILALVVYLGLAERVLDRMRLTDVQAIIILVAIALGGFLPAIETPFGFSIDVGGGLVPLGVAIYLLVTADTGKERGRALLATLLAAAAIVLFDNLPSEGTQAMPIDLDPLWFPGIISGIIAYLVCARSRRAAFIAGISSVVISDLIAAGFNMARGLSGSHVVIGGAGALDSALIAGVFAVALAEMVGEIREAMQGGHEPGTTDPALEEALAQGEHSGDWGHRGIGTRTKRDPRPAYLLIAAVLVVGVLWTNNVIELPMARSGMNEVSGSQGMTMYDTRGNPIVVTGLSLNNGDEYIALDNEHWRVFAVKDASAWARSLGTVNLQTFIDAVTESSYNEQPRQTVLKTSDDPLTSNMPTAAALPTAGEPTNPKGIIGIYHTHNDESYLPDQGYDSIYGEGGIHEVGATLTEELWTRNIGVLHRSDMHLPHDRGAYRRSRDTIAQIIGNYPDMVIDMHRDATPPEAYYAEVNGLPIAQVQMVVGQQNPNYDHSMKVAAGLKAISDSMYPGLIKGIFIAQGNYNQDLYPTAVLMECGAHTNYMEHAKNAMPMLAEVLDRYLYGP